MTTPMQTRSQTAQAATIIPGLAPLAHVLRNDMSQPDNSPLQKALDYNGYVTPMDFITEPDDSFIDLEYHNDAGTLVKISKGNAGLLKSFKHYVAFKASQGTPINDWLSVTIGDYNTFRASNSFSPVLSVPPPAQSMPPTARPPPVIDLVRDFKRGIKRDPSQFSIFKDDATWDNWNRSTIAQARTQDIEDVLKPSFIPVTIEDIQLFEEKQKFMYAVFEKTLLTDKGKALVRQHQQSFNAQRIYKELSDYAVHSTKAAMIASTMLSYITSATLGDGKWKGSTHSFILHWQDQIRKYCDLNPKHTLLPKLLCSLLQNAIHPIAELRQIKVQAAQLQAATGKGLSYDDYCTLLLSAAQQYDQQTAEKTDKAVKRRIYSHDIYPDHDEDDEYHDTYDIDHPLDLLEAHATNFNKGPRLSYEQWHALPDDAKKIWDTLSQEAKAIILRPPPKPNPNCRPAQFQHPSTRNGAPPPRCPFQPRRNVNEHDIDYQAHVAACLHELHGGGSATILLQ